MQQSERCIRCGKSGPDLRNLWHASFYLMEELGLPFEQWRILGVQTPKVATKPRISGLEHLPEIPVYAEPGDANPTDYHFYVLSVCKRCRTDWLAAIQAW